MPIRTPRRQPPLTARIPETNQVAARPKGPAVVQPAAVSAKSTMPSLRDILRNFKIDNWDLLLIGDGSGSSGDRPIGWACIAIDRAEIGRRVFHGAANFGTVNNAELMAYLLPLTWYLNKNNEQKGRDVHIITDSTYTTRVGGGLNSAANTAFYAVYRQFERCGLRLHWHWLNRNSIALHALADDISRVSRVGFTEAATVCHDKISRVCELNAS